MNLLPAQIDALRELINIGVGKAAAVLSEMIECHITLQVPYIKMLTKTTLLEEIQGIGQDRFAAVKLGFHGSFTGTAALVFPPDSAIKLVTVLTNEEAGTPDLDAVMAGTLSEVGNIVINGVMGSISNVLKQHINYSLPAYIEDVIVNLLHTQDLNADTAIILAHTQFTIEQLQIEGNIILLFETRSFDALVAAIDKDLC